MKALFIYNLFPRLYKNVDEWKNAVDKIKSMRFNSIYINPFHYTGFSGSLYAVKDYYKYSELFFDNEASAEKELKDFISLCNDKGIDVFMDLVVNHTAFDADLVATKKDWYKLEQNGEIKNPGAWQDGKWVTWGDLATFDLEESPDKENLWDFLLKMCQHYLKLGFKGFRCDAAYQVNSEFWTFLISNIKSEFKNILFLAETLGCTPVQIQSLSTCGFDYIFNSSKWWNFNDPWCLEQYDLTRNIAPSISFPESHDTPRLLEELNNDQAAFLQRLYFSAVFSKGFMITSGFEYGFKKRLSPVSSTPDDWEDTGKDFTKQIKDILYIKEAFAPLHEESPIEIVEHSNWHNVFCFSKDWEGQKVLVCLNKDTKNAQKLELGDLEQILNADKIKKYFPVSKKAEYIKKLDVNLKPGEIFIFGSENHFKPAS